MMIKHGNREQQEQYGTVMEQFKANKYRSLTIKMG